MTTTESDFINNSNCFEIIDFNTKKTESLNIKFLNDKVPNKEYSVSKPSSSVNKSEPISEKNFFDKNNSNEKIATNFSLEKKSSKKTISNKSIVKKTKKYFSNSLALTFKEIFTYVGLGLFILLVVFLVFVYDENTFLFIDKISDKSKSTTQLNDSLLDSIPQISSSDKDFFQLFEHPDSIILIAKSNDTA